MKVLYVSTYDRKGGAALVAWRLMQEVASRGHEVHMLCGLKSYQSQALTEIGSLSSPFRLVRGIANRLERLTGLQYLLLKPRWADIKRVIDVEEFDVVHFHNTHGSYLHLDITAEVAREKPVIWTLHDMWGLTGHCAWANYGNCDQWRRGCGKCPALGDYPELWRDSTQYLWRRKAANALKGGKMIWCVSPSIWLHELAKMSLLHPHQHRHINNGVELTLFRPQDQESLRDKLGLPLNRFILCFAANGGTKNPQKGFTYLLEALQHIRSSNLSPYLLVVGENAGFECGKAGFDGRIVGHVGEKEMADLLSASDALAVPSLLENQPLIILESLACGTPVVCFSVGGITELIRHKHTGFLASPRNSVELAAGVKWLMDLSNEERQKMRLRSRAVALANFDLKSHVQGYLSLYDEAKSQFGRLSRKKR